MQQIAELTETQSPTTERVVTLPVRTSGTRWSTVGSWFLKARTVVLLDLLVVGLVMVTLGRLAVPVENGRAYAAALVLGAGLTLYTLRRRRTWTVGMELSALDEAPSLLVAGLLPPVLVYFLFSLVTSVSLDPVTFAVLAVSSAGALVLERSLLRAFQRFLRRKGVGLRNTLIIGAGTIGSMIAKRLVSNPELGLRPVGFIDKEPLLDPVERMGIPVLGSSRELSRAIFEYEVGMVIVAFSTAPHEVLLRIVATCQERGVALAVVPRLFETITQGRGFDRLRGIPVIGVSPIRLSGVLWWAKRVFDAVSSGVLLVVLSPLIGLLAGLIKLDSDGPVFYRQDRVGRDGRPFKMVKFRTMAEDAESTQGGAMWSDTVECGAGTAYVTRAGRVLRKTSLDELPQLINVLRGDMSLVGPRPERPVFVNRFVHDIYRYGDRMRVKAGMTGWAQVNGLKGNHGSLAERVEYDNYYIENWSPWLDAKIIAMTLQQIYRDVRGLS